VLGAGAVTPIGRELRVIREKLIEAVGGGDEAARVDDSLLLNTAASVQLRRADRFTRMAVIAAGDAWGAAAGFCAGVAPERIGLILSSGFGPHCRGFKFLDGILDAGDTAASPTDFSHSVHGAAAAYISRLLDIRGPSLSITDFEIGFEEAVRIAQCWLNEKACDRVLIGATDELGEVYLSCAQRMLKGRAIRPGEGAVFFVLGPGGIGEGPRLDAAGLPGEVDLLAVEDPALHGGDGGVGGIVAGKTVCFTRAFGYSASGGAFALLGVLLELGAGMGIDTAATLRTSSEGRAITLVITSAVGRGMNEGLEK
jgi:hypothetical protein